MNINKNQEQEIENLKIKNVQLAHSGEQEREQADSLEQYGRRQNLEIVKVPYEKKVKIQIKLL